MLTHLRRLGEASKAAVWQSARRQVRSGGVRCMTSCGLAPRTWLRSSRPSKRRASRRWMASLRRCCSDSRRGRPRCFHSYCGFIHMVDEVRV